MFQGERSRSAWLLLLTFLLVCPSLPSRPQAPDAKLGELADQLMYGHSQHPRKKAKNRAKEPYLMVDFLTDASRYDRLGTEIANEFAQALHENCPEIATLDRSELGALLEKEHLGPKVLQVEDVALWFASLEGARSVIFGKISPHDNALDLTTRLVDTRGKELSRATQSIEWSQERHALSELPARDLAKNPTSETPQEAMKPGTAGVPEPKCEYCPQPPYSEEARRAHIEGSLILSIWIRKDGSTHVMSVPRSLPQGLTVMAVDTVRKWKFIPPAGPEGKPIEMDLTVEISFHLLH